MYDSYFRHEEERHCEQRSERLFLVFILLTVIVVATAALLAGGVL